MQIKTENNYQNFDIKGKGTYGTVFKALGKGSYSLDRYHNKEIAVKKFKHVIEKQGVQSSTIREIGLLKSLKHPNIISFINFQCHAKFFYLIMEIANQNLKEYLNSHVNEQLNPTLIKFFPPITKRGQLFTLKQNNTQRSQTIKFINFKNQILKIADFGLAKNYGIPETKITTNVVTYYYRSSELFLSNKQYSYQIDMWSVGCIIAQLISNKVLFFAQSEQHQLTAIFSIIGTPSETLYPQLTTFSGWKKNKFKKYNKINLQSIFNDFDQDGLDLLKPEPKKRIKAKDALKHKYFEKIQKNQLPNYENNQ